MKHYLLMPESQEMGSRIRFRGRYLAFILTLPLLFSFIMAGGQTQVFFDDFGTVAAAPYTSGGIPLMTYTPASTISPGGNTNTILNAGTDYFLAIYNRSTSPAAGRTYLTGTLSTFDVPYALTLNNNPGPVTWTFNAKTNRSTALSGFGDGNYGSAIVLAATGSDLTTANGYAVIEIKGTSNNAFKLISFTNGLIGTSTLTTIIGPSIDLSSSTNWASIKIVYNPTTNVWQFYFRDDGTSPLDPTSGTLTQVGTNTVNTIYTGTTMSNFGFFFDHGGTSAGSSNRGQYDNFKVTVMSISSPLLAVTPSILNNFAYLIQTGPSPAQSYSLSGQNLTGFPGTISVTGSTNYEVSSDNSSFSSSIGIPYSGSTLSSTPVFVRLKANLPAGDYNGEAISNAGGGVSSPVTVTCNGMVLPLPSTYTWQGADMADWTVASNWNPVRTTTVVNDILQFNDGTTKTVTNVPTQTIGQLTISNATSVNLQSGGPVTLALSGAPGTDLSVSAGSALNLNAATATSTIIISLGSGVTGSISGNMTFNATVPMTTSGHQLLATDGNAVSFQSGSVFTSGANFFGNPFGTTNLNSILFLAGSSFIQSGGSNPFGAAAPNSVVTFQSGSFYKFNGIGGGPSFSGRTYSNFEIDAPGRTMDNQGSSTFTCDNFVITGGTVNMDFSGPISIKGNILANDVLTFGNATKITNVTMNGSAAQVIGGTGTLLFGANGTLLVSNAAGVSIDKSFTLNNVSISSGSPLTVNASKEVNLAGNLLNLNPSPSGLGSGSIVLSGTATQTISGQNIFNNLTINSSGGVSLASDNQVNGALTLTNGLLTLGPANLSLGSAATISGTPSSTAMIVATAAGRVKKEFSSGFTGSFTYPVGDNTGAAEYSPVTLNFSAGAFAAGNYVGVNLVNAKYPDDPNTTNYLSRYWTIAQSGVTTFTCNATFQYLPADVTGLESQIFCLKTDPLPVTIYSAANALLHQLNASNLGSFSTFTGSQETRVDVTIATDATSVCAGIPVTFTATAVNGGSTPAYAWYVNNVLIPSATSSGYTYSPASNDAVKCVLTSSLVRVTNNPATSNVLTATVTDVPPSPGEVQGRAYVYPGLAGITYSVPAMPTASGYLWNIPQGAVITAGQNTNAITVTFGAGATSGTFKVRGLNNCGNGLWSPDFDVTVTAAPPNVLTVTGQTVSGTTCFNALETIVVGGSSGAFTVTPNGSATFIAGQKIQFLPGTTVQPGGYLRGTITTTSTYCPPAGPAIQSPIAADSEDRFVEKSGFKVYPNPVEESFTLELTDPASTGPVTVYIFRMTGEPIFVKSFPGDTKYVLNLGGYPSGVYFLKAFDQNHAATIKIIKQ